MIYSFILRFVFFCIYITYKYVLLGYDINHAMKCNVQIYNHYIEFAAVFFYFLKVNGIELRLFENEQNFAALDLA